MAKKTERPGMLPSKTHTVIVEGEGPDGKSHYEASFDLEFPVGSKLTGIRSGADRWVVDNDNEDALRQAMVVEEGMRVFMENFLRNTVAQAFSFARDMLDSAAVRRIVAAGRK